MATGVERHELDEAHLDVVIAPEAGEVDDLVVVDAALHDGIDLDRLEAGLLGGLDAVEHTHQLVAPGHLQEPIGAQRVETDVDAIEPGLAKFVGDQTERGAVGGEGQIRRLAGTR